MLMKKAINILGVPVTPFSMEEAVSFLMDRIAKKMPTQVVTANAEIIMMARNDKRYGTLLQQADLVLADGAGTVWAGRTLGYEVPERVAGFDLFVELIKKSAEEGIKLYFFGAAPGIAEAAKACEDMQAAQEAKTQDSENADAQQKQQEKDTYYKEHVNTVNETIARAQERIAKMLQELQTEVE